MSKPRFHQFLNYRLPNKKKWLLTDEFLTTFKEELDRIFKVYEKEENPTYWNTYAHLDSTGGFYKALKITSEKYNVKKAIYEYASRMPWYHSDLFDSELTELMYKRNIIEEGNVNDINPDDSSEQMVEWEQNGEIEWYEDVRYFKGYNVTTRDWRFVKEI